MISRASSWRRGGGSDGREALPPAGSIDYTATAGATAQAYWGKITSRPQPTRRDIEYLAWRLGCTYAAAKQAIDQGLI